MTKEVVYGEHDYANIQKFLTLDPKASWATPTMANVIRISLMPTPSEKMGDRVRKQFLQNFPGLTNASFEELVAKYPMVCGAMACSPPILSNSTLDPSFQEFSKTNAQYHNSYTTLFNQCKEVAAEFDNLTSAEMIAQAAMRLNKLENQLATTLLAEHKLGEKGWFSALTESPRNKKILKQRIDSLTAHAKQTEKASVEPIAPSAPSPTQQKQQAPRTLFDRIRAAIGLRKPPKPKAQEISGPSGIGSTFLSPPPEASKPSPSLPPPPALPEEVRSKISEYIYHLNGGRAVEASKVLHALKTSGQDIKTIHTEIATNPRLTPELLEIFAKQSGYKIPPPVAPKPTIAPKPITALNTSIVSVKSANDEMRKILDEYKKGPIPSQTLVDKVSYTPPASGTLRDNIESLTKFMDIAEENMDLRRGIIRQTQTNALAHIGAQSNQKSDVIIRDAREQTPEQAKLKPEDTPESWVIAAAARTRGALKLIEIANVTKGGDKDAREKAQAATLKIFNGYKAKLESATTAKERSSSIQEMDYELSLMLKQSGLKIGEVDLAKCRQEKDIAKMLSGARDACNFERDNHPSIVTITSNLAPDGSKKINQVIASIPTTPCAMREKYFGATMKQQPWYAPLRKSKKPVNQIKAALTDSYQDKIADGKHVTPTQLRWLPGTANTYVQDVSYLIDGVHDTERGFTSLRTAAPVHGRGDGAKNKSLTNDNIQHINSLVGERGKYVGLNSDTGAIAGLIGQRSEQNITDGMRDAAGDTFVSAPISVSRNKDNNLEKATDTLLGKEGGQASKTSKWQRIVKVFCKSGKDRTQAALEEAGMNDAHKVVQEECKAARIMPDILLETSMKIKQAAHGEAMAGGNGSTRGSYGTKIGNVYGSGLMARLVGMKLTRGLILSVKKLATNKIQKSTAMTHLKKPKKFLGR